MHNLTQSRLSQLMMLIFYIGISLGMAPAKAADYKPAQHPATKQELQQLTSQTLTFLQREVSAYSGKVELSVLPLDPNLKLAACPAPHFAVANGGRAWGKTTVMIQCMTPSRWTIYQQANVSVMADYLVAAVPLAPGHQITEADVLSVKGDLSKLPAGIFTDVKQVLGRSVSVSQMAGAVLRHETLKQPNVIQLGQNVMVRTVGKGFQISTEGKALGHAVNGQMVQVKVASGEVITGVARDGGQVEVSF